MNDQVDFEGMFGNRPTKIPCNSVFLDDEYVPNAANAPFITC